MILKVAQKYKLALLILIAPILIVQSVPAAIDYTNDKLYLPINQTFIDYAVPNHTISLFSDPTVDLSTKKFGAGSGYFDGNDYIEVAGSSDFNFGTGPFSLQLWFNTGSPSSTPIIQSYNYASANGNWNLRMTDSTHYGFYTYSGGGSSEGGECTVPTIPLNTWAVLTLTRNSSNGVTLFENGVRRCGWEITKSLNDGANGIRIASDRASTFYTGYFDDIRIVNNTEIDGTVVPTVEHISPLPIAKFIADPMNGTQILSVQFTDTSENSPSTWSWSRRNLTHVTGEVFNTTQNPIESFVAGKWIVNLTVTNGAGSDVSDEMWINVTHVTANFVADTTAGLNPLTVQFTDTSTMVDIVSWNWSPKSGVWTNITNPSLKDLSYTYTSAGIYDVILQVENSTASSSLTRSNYISVYDPVSASFTVNTTAGYPIFAVQFTNTDSNATSWYWDFGDGSTSTSENPSHVFTTPGTFSIKHSASNPVMTSWINTTSITAYDPPGIFFIPIGDYAGSLSKNVTKIVFVRNLTEIDAIRIKVSHIAPNIETHGWNTNNTIFSDSVTVSEFLDNSTGFTEVNVSKPTRFNSATMSVDNPLGDLDYNYYNTSSSPGLPLNFVTADFLFGGTWRPFLQNNTGQIVPRTEYNIQITYKDSRTLSIITNPITIIWSGPKTGTTGISTGTYNLSMPNGTAMVYSTSVGYYGVTSIYTVSGADQSQTVYLTETEDTVVTGPPKSVRFHVQGIWGEPLGSVLVTAQAVSTPLGNWDWLAELLGYPIGEVPLNNTVMSGTTDDQGDIAFLMMESTKYNVTAVKTDYVFDSLHIYPHDDRYFIIAKQNGTPWYTGNYNYLDAINVTMEVSEVSSTEGFVNITYYDPLGGTSSGSIKVMQRSSIPGSAPTVIAEHPINSPYAFCSTHIVHTGPDQFDGYMMTNITNSNVGGPINMTKTFWFKGEPLTLPGVDPKVSLFFALFIIIVTAMFAGASHAPQVSFIVCFECWIFYGIGFFRAFFDYFNESKFVVSLIFATFVSLLWIFNEKKRKEKY